MDDDRGGATIHFDGDGVRLAARASGNPQGQPILFFHGQGQSKNLWAKASEIVGANGYYGLSFDLRGHGESGWAADGDYSMEGYARDIASVIDQLDRPVTLVGGSRGGQVALLAACWRQNRIRLLTLCDAAPNVTLQGPNIYLDFFQASVNGFGSIEEVAAALKKHLKFHVKDPAGLRARMLERDGRLFWHWDPRTAAPEYFEAEPDAERLSAAVRGISCPVLLLKGGRETVVTDSILREFQAMVPQLVVEVVHGARHIFTVRDNSTVARRLLHHLRSGIGAIADPANNRTSR